MTSKKKRGRPISGEGEQVFALWRELGEPSPHQSGLAKAFFGKQYEEASGTTRRQMRDRIREHLLRQLDREIAKLQAELTDRDAKIAELEAEIAKRRALDGQPSST
jgi:predicted RNase H-like nuclease (RuvC/YqgF family)